jgi:adenine phosphoribosyltransferase
MSDQELSELIRSNIRDIQDFPKPGILFKDLSTLMLNPELMQIIVHALGAKAPDGVEAIAGMESRGFWFGPALAMHLKVPFVPLRKPGKLPGATIGIDYALEYGTNRLEVHEDAFQQGQRVLIHDDLLATGGTAKAAWKLVQKAGAIPVGCSFLFAIDALEGEAALQDSCRNIAILARQ